MSGPLRMERTLRPEPWTADHRHDGKAVLPAVLAVRLLAGCVRGRFPRLALNTMQKMRFRRFLPLEMGADSACAVTVELVPAGVSGVRARLLSRLRGRHMARMLEHADLCFTGEGETLQTPAPQPPECTQHAPPFTIAPRRLYRELVPFGPAFRTVCGPLALTPVGAAASLAGRGGAMDPDLGSPFPLDGAFHVACAWGQRYAGVVAFPVAIDRHVVCHPLGEGEPCRCIVRPAVHPVPGGGLRFDIWILGRRGRIREIAQGVTMQDVSRGRLKPPGWVRAEG
jgi:hypothetical protein